MSNYHDLMLEPVSITQQIETQLANIIENFGMPTKIVMGPKQMAEFKFEWAIENPNDVIAWVGIYNPGTTPIEVDPKLDGVKVL
jgi:hypothetical protein